MKNLIITLAVIIALGNTAQAGVKVEAKLNAQILFLINQERATHGLSQLTLVDIPEAKQNCERLLCEDRAIREECSQKANAEYNSTKQGFDLASYKKTDEYKQLLLASIDSVKKGLLAKPRVFVPKSALTDNTEVKKAISEKWTKIRDTKIEPRMHASYEANALAVAKTIPNGQLYEIVDYSAGQHSSAITIVEDFKNSPAHHDIMLEPTASYIAIGTSVDAQGGIFCTVFIISVN